MKNQCLLISLCLLFTIALCENGYTQQSSPKWTLIYENDDNGNAVYGEKETLMEAIRNGEDIRIGWKHQSPTNPKVKVEHWANAKFITIMSDETILAQIDPIVGQTPNFDDQTIILKENFEWSMIASSSGKNDHMTRKVMTGEIMSHQKSRWGIKWYIKK